MVLACAAVGVTGWLASAGATGALRAATDERLTAIRETRRHALEQYFENLTRHVVALSTSETSALALQDLGQAWTDLTPLAAGSPEHDGLRRFYAETLAPRVSAMLSREALLATWFPPDPRVWRAQHHAISANPYPPGSKDLRLDLPGAGRYGEAHARHHPTFHRYQTAFGFYDIFLISAPDGRVLYSVMKEVDLGAVLTAAPYKDTGLGRVYARAMARTGTDPEASVVVDDYAPYIASAFAPAAFVAAPVRVAGATVGVLAMQLSIREVDRVMTGARNWRDAGFGNTGQVYVVGADNTLRSDLRAQVEDPAKLLVDLQAAGVRADAIDRIRRDQTTVLNLPVMLPPLARPGRAAGVDDTEAGVNLLGQPVLRSRAAVDIPGLQWTLVAEVNANEALAPVRALQGRLLTAGLFVGVLFFVVGGWMGASVARPVLELARTVARLGAGQRGATVAVRSRDEVGQLADAFNRMSADLERTTVSKAELEVLAGRLISAQEDERRRVARELHDDLVQRLAAMAIEVGRLERQTPGAEQHAGLAALKRRLATLSEDVHGLSRRLHPATLEEQGLLASIEHECRAFTERGGPPVDLRADGSFDGLPSPVALALFRIVQESLRNASQHARATEVSITVHRASQDVTLDVVDDGAGFDRGQPGWRGGLGLASMEERARLLGGTCDVTSSPGAGTRVRVVLPITSAAPEAA
jgi:signal transduction histidine kinase